MQPPTPGRGPDRQASAGAPSFQGPAAWYLEDRALDAPASAGRVAAVIGLHALAVLTAASGGVLAREALSTTLIEEDLALELLLVGGGVLLGILSLLAQLAAAVAHRRGRWAESLLAQGAGVLVGGVLLLLLAAIGVLTFTTLLGSAGNVLGVLALALAAGGALAAALQRRTPQGRRRAGWLLGAGSATAVTYFAPWWVINGALLVLGLLSPA